MTAVLGLGTVQFGTTYGVSNTQGMPSSEGVHDILVEARCHGVHVLDTAALYGASEEVLGQQDLSGFKIVTKTPRFASSTIQLSQADELKNTFQRSLQHLGQESVYALLSHHADDLLAPGGDYLWRAMEDIKQQGGALKIGVSVYSGCQIDELMDRYPLDIVQLPFNVLDQRLDQGGQLERLNKAGVEVHARSTFLQGLLLMDTPPAYFKPISSYIKRWHSAVAEQGVSATQAALAFVRDQPAIDVVLVGVTEVNQLLECVKDFEDQFKFDGYGLHCNIPEFVDPSKWKIK